jgi:Zn-dependent protease with chaperone function
MAADLFPSSKKPARRASRRPPPAYLAGLMMVGSAVVLLPLAYATLVLSLAGGTLWHLRAHAGWIAGPDAGAATGFLYVLAALALFLPCVFLLRPFFARSPGHLQGLELSPAEEPRLHTFIHQICEALGAPVPERIRASMDVNASARFSPGVASVVEGRLELTLGLPLVRGLDLSQFAGVLAHELGHFGQGGAMRLVHTIRSVNIWFARAASLESAWERRTPDAGIIGSLVMPFLALARGCAVLARWILRVHVRMGQVISCLLLRQMERQADLAAIRLVGGETFAGMVLEAKVLEAAWGLANRSLGLALREGRLADDLPALVAAHTRVFIPEIRRKMEQGLLLERTALFDTHPSLAERVAFARRIPGRGIFHASGAAHSLFTDFPTLSRVATEDFYRQDLGSEFRPDRMVTTADLVTGHSEAQVGEAAVSGYFGGLTTPLRPLCIDPGHLEAARAAGARARLAASRERVEAGLNRASESLRAYAAVDARRLDAAQAMALTKARFLIEPGDFQLERQGHSHAEATWRASEAKLRDLGASLTGFESALKDRLASALALLGEKEVKDRLGDASVLHREAARLVPVLGLLGEAQPCLDTLRTAFHALAILIENIDGNEGARELDEQMRHLSAALRRDLSAIRAILGDHPHPFSPAASNITVAAYAMEALPGEGDIGGMYHAAEEALERCHALHGRIMGRLALAAGRVEGALGFGALQMDLFPLSASQEGDQEPEAHEPGSGKAGHP